MCFRFKLRGFDEFQNQLGEGGVFADFLYQVVARTEEVRLELRHIDVNVHLGLRYFEWCVLARVPETVNYGAVEVHAHFVAGGVVRYDAPLSLNPLFLICYFEVARVLVGHFEVGRREARALLKGVPVPTKVLGGFALPVVTTLFFDGDCVPAI